MAETLELSLSWFSSSLYIVSLAYLFEYYTELLLLSHLARAVIVVLVEVFRH
jgi:hypothetical protein